MGKHFGKLTISMVMFNSYFDITRGYEILHLGASLVSYGIFPIWTSSLWHSHGRYAFWTWDSAKKRLRCATKCGSLGSKNLGSQEDLVNTLMVL